MNLPARPTSLLSLSLVLAMATAACSSQWINVALTDLPVLAQMALNIAALSATMQGKPMSSGDASAIQGISSEATKDLTLLKALFNDYKAQPSQTGLQKINDAIGVLQSNLPAVLNAAHISDPLVSQRVTAGVSLILTTVESFAALMPSSQPANVHAQMAPRAKLPVPTASQLKQSWNQQVCPEPSCQLK